MAVDWRETLVTYLNSEDTESAAKALNITKASLNQRLGMLRKKGVKIPKKEQTTFTDLFVAQLNSLVKKHEKQN